MRPIVIDVGCHYQPPEESVHRLIERFHPELLIGIDPDPDLDEGIEQVDGTTILRVRRVAWITAQPQPVEYDGICTGVDFTPNRPTVLTPAVDLLALLAMLPGRPILKLDCEGAEYELLGAIHDEGLDEELGLVLVEWHPADLATDHGRGWNRQQIVAFAGELRCPVEEWAYATTPVLAVRR